MREEDIKGHIINEVLADLGAYLQPEVFKDEYQNSLIDPTRDKKEIEKYNRLLSNVHYAWIKTKRYEIYFDEFYSTSANIENYEQLNHHIHAYLQDMDTLKNKIQNLFGSLKNDIKNVASNKDEFIGFMEAGVDKTREVFNQILKYREQHVHSGGRFMDGDLLKVENAHTFIQLLNQPIIDSMVKPESKLGIIERFEKEKKESFEIAKARWIKTAQNNNLQTSGYLDAILNVLRPTLYQYLDIRAMKEIINSINESKDS